MKREALRAWVGVALLAVAGCNSPQIVQTNYFVDDDGAILRVDYGRANRDHINTFRSPANGREMEFKSKLAVDVCLPDGDRFTAWQCMNFAGNGTLYRTDDEEWYFLASGFTCRVARQDETQSATYNEIYRGVLCNTPVKMPEKDTRWRKVNPGVGKEMQKCTLSRTFGSSWSGRFTRGMSAPVVARWPTWAYITFASPGRTCRTTG